MATGPGRREFGERAESARRENTMNNGRAARTVAGHAVDAQDCRLLLEMLGLDTEAAPKPQGRADSELAQPDQ